MLLRISSLFENASAKLSKFSKGSRYMHGVSYELALESWCMSLTRMSGVLWHTLALVMGNKKLPGIVVWSCVGSYSWLTGAQNDLGCGFPVKKMALGPAGVWRLDKGHCLEVALAGMLGHISVPCFLHIPRVPGWAAVWRVRVGCMPPTYIPAYWQGGGNHAQHCW